MSTNCKTPTGFQIIGDNTDCDAGFDLRAFSHEPNINVGQSKIDDQYIDLLGSIIKQTALDLFDQDALVRAQAHAWLQDEDARRPKIVGGITFCYICDLFDLEPEWLRKKLYEFAHLKAIEKAERLEQPPETYVNRIPRNEK